MGTVVSDPAAPRGEVAARPGVALLSRGVVRVRGKDHLRFLQGMLTNDVAGLAPFQGCSALLLSQKGRVLADLVAVRGQDEVTLVCEGAAAPLAAALDRFVIMDDVVLEPLERDALLVLGPPPPGLALPERVGSMLGDVLRGSFAGEPALWCFGERAALEAEARRLSAAGYAPLSQEDLSLRCLERGWPRLGVDFAADEILPMEAGLDRDHISFQKGCYVGQEVVVRATSRGGVKHRLVPLRIEGDTVPERGATVVAESRPEAGRVTSAGRSPTAGVLALAYLWRDAAVPGAHVRVTVPGGSLAAVVAAVPDTDKELS